MVVQVQLRINCTRKQAVVCTTSQLLYARVIVFLDIKFFDDFLSPLVYNPGPIGSKSGGAKTSFGPNLINLQKNDTTFQFLLFDSSSLI